ncbi:hypothetical protein [Fuscovulum blasticum]|uniref:hypothetical protein n=1 Tax=Fuscovulum blasticum TaxID=1075 RepID=UPI0013DF280E|nr:hypothetical protein [Fuscovulum blasticum]
MTDEITRLVEKVRARADVPRVRSSEIRKIIETLAALAGEGLIDLAALTPEPAETT